MKTFTPPPRKNLLIKAFALVFASALSLTCFFGCNFGGGNLDNPPDNGNNNGDNTQPSKYSKILESILTDENYNSIIKEAKEDFNFYRSASFDPHPYGFLKKKGHNIDAVKSGDLECRTVSYVLDEEPNNLYIMTYVENASSDPYYTEYTLKYTLSEQEMKDYKFLHKDGSNYYVQAVFMNDAISKTKKETIVSETKMNVKAHKEMRDSIAKITTVKNKYKNTKINFVMNSFNESNQTFDLKVFPMHSNNTSMIIKDKMLELYLERDNQKLSIINDIYYAPTTGGDYAFLPNLTKEHVTTYYHSQDTILGNIYTQDLNDQT